MATQVYKLLDGTRVPGVTTILGVLNKPQLVVWANTMGLKGINTSTYVDELAKVGSLAHYLIMCDLTAQTPNVRDYTPAQQDAAAESIKSWLAWRRVHDIQPILTEAPLVSEQYRYGGTLDLFAYIDGVPTLADIKTAKAIYGEHMTQVVGYQQLLMEAAERQALPACADMRVIRVGREPGEGFEERPIDQIPTRWELFLACLQIYDLQKRIK